jgi:N-acetylglucosaminyldiphosphoundecaprenol N-acetyl-beta-D-mannosaminyltransferase
VTMNDSSQYEIESSRERAAKLITSFPPQITNFYRDVHCILGLPFDALDLSQAQATVTSTINTGHRCFLSTPNLNFLIGCLDDEQFRNSVIHSDMSLADGMPLIWIARLLGIPVTTRVAGSTLFERLRQQTSLSIKVFFFGGPDGVAEKAGTVLNNENKGMHCVGTVSPGFGTIDEMSSAALIDKINVSNPDFLVVALGAKRGQAWIENNLHRLNVPVVSHLGAVVNFVAGTVTRAPELIGQLGLEWAWRIKEEPVLWRRYCADGFALLGLLVKPVASTLLSNFKTKINNKKSNLSQVIVENKDNYCCIILEGDWSRHNLKSLRDTLTEVTACAQNIQIDMGKISSIDSAFIGLLILLYGHQSKIKASFLLVKTSKKIEQTLSNFCAQYLLEHSSYNTISMSR